MTNVNTIQSFLNDDVLRADWPKMNTRTYESAIRLAAFVGRSMTGFVAPTDVEPEDETSPAPQQQYYVSFSALRKALPRTVLQDITLWGPKLMDFMSVINEVSGLSVIHTSDGLWFFDMRNRFAAQVVPHREFAKHYEALTPDTGIPQFDANEDDGDDEDGDW